MNTLNKLLLITMAALLTACSAPSSNSRYSIDKDVGPDEPIVLDHIEDAHPSYEPFSRGGNRDYKLRGNAYQIVKQPDGFKQRGKASWYGKKFHGHLTANGEVYDMYSMTAAHKTLPIPSYVKVTNLDNGKAAVVRVNDRGPFYDGRVIDLSYAAAYKLDVIKTGTANVAIEYITTKPVSAKKAAAKPVAPAQTPTPSTTNSDRPLVIQVASSTHEQRIRTLAKNMSQTFSVTTLIESVGANYRLLLGPFSASEQANDTLTRVKAEGYTQAFIRKSPH